MILVFRGGVELRGGAEVTCRTEHSEAAPSWARTSPILTCLTWGTEEWCRRSTHTSNTTTGPWGARTPVATPAKGSPRTTMVGLPSQGNRPKAYHTRDSRPTTGWTSGTRDTTKAWITGRIARGPWGTWRRTATRRRWCTPLASCRRPSETESVDLRVRRRWTSTIITTRATTCMATPHRHSPNNTPWCTTTGPRNLRTIKHSKWCNNRPPRNHLNPTTTITTPTCPAPSTPGWGVSSVSIFKVLIKYLLLQTRGLENRMNWSISFKVL